MKYRVWFAGYGILGQSRAKRGGDSRRHGAFVAVRLPRRMYARLRVNDHARMSERAHMQLSV